MAELYQLLTTLGTRTAPPAPSFPSLITQSDEAAAAAAAAAAAEVAAGSAATTAAPPRANSTVAAFNAKPTSISRRNPPAAQRPVQSDGAEATAAAMPKGWKPVFSESDANAAAAEAVGVPAAEPAAETSPSTAGGKHKGGGGGGLPQRERKSKSKKGSTTNYVIASNGPGPQAFGCTQHAG
jgi:hypothetical protein